MEREVAYRYVSNENPLCPTIRECRHAPPGVHHDSAIAVMDRRLPNWALRASTTICVSVFITCWWNWVGNSPRRRRRRREGALAPIPSRGHILELWGGWLWAPAAVSSHPVRASAEEASERAGRGRLVAAPVRGWTWTRS